MAGINFADPKLVRKSSAKVEAWGERSNLGEEGDLGRRVGRTRSMSKKAC